MSVCVESEVWRQAGSAFCHIMLKIVLRLWPRDMTGRALAAGRLLIH